ncbi:MAG: threonylcarbamoyl-AMP synthase [Deltaproteobacteria bacterium]|nr:threonylcarbamoyl-AMP synthase [Deltaproteobacteria bacterium]
MIRLSIDPDDLGPDSLHAAVEVLRSGGIVAYPTESSYGLGADVRIKAACERIYEIKSRNPKDPLPVLVPRSDYLDRWGQSVSDAARRLARAFWPGGLTIVVKAKPEVPKHVLSETGCVGLRFPGHPVALTLVKRLGSPITATSANRSGEPAITTGSDIRADLLEGVDLVLDGGTTPGAPASTVVDAVSETIVVIRRGPVTLEMIESVVRNGKIAI